MRQNKEAANVDPDGPRATNRLQQVRQMEGVSLRALAARMNQNVELLREQEAVDSDIRLSELYRWQNALKVPACELLNEPGESLSDPIRERACLLRVARMAKWILENSSDRDVKRLTTCLLRQLRELMPELKDVRSEQPK